VEFIVQSILTGLLVGGLVSLTGLGGGVLLLPALILGLHVPPIVAVGSAAAFSVFAKILAGSVHWRRGNVDWSLVAILALGSVPGALVGLEILKRLRATYGEGVNEILTFLIGVLLILVPVLMMLQARVAERGGPTARHFIPPWVTWYHGALFTGVCGGVLVGMTSVGSGSVIMMLLLVFFRRKPVKLVGTDIVHAIILMGVTTVFHLKMGTVDYRLVLWLVVGSIPGVFWGTRLARVITADSLRSLLFVVLIASGILMLM